MSFNNTIKRYQSLFPDIDYRFGSPENYSGFDGFGNWGDIYTQSDCYALATAIHNITNWNMVVLTDQPKDAFLDGDVSIAHVVVEHPEEFWIDINGPQHPDVILSEWAELGCSYYFSAVRCDLDSWFYDQEPMNWDITTAIAMNIINSISEA